MPIIKLRRKSGASWASDNTVLGSGEPGVETDDTSKLKVGNGSDPWTVLPYVGGSGGGGGGGSDPFGTPLAADDPITAGYPSPQHAGGVGSPIEGSKSKVWTAWNADGDGNDQGVEVYVTAGDDEVGAGPFAYLYAYDPPTGPDGRQAGVLVRSSPEVGGTSAAGLYAAPSYAQLSVNAPSGQNQPPFRAVSADGWQVLVTVDGDIELTTPSQGVILHSPDNTRHRIKVANDGTLSTEVVT